MYKTFKTPHPEMGKYVISVFRTYVANFSPGEPVLCCCGFNIRVDLPIIKLKGKNIIS